METDHTVKLWSPATGAESRILRGHTEQVNATVLSPDGKILATASSDKTVRLWDPATGELLGVSGHTVAVDALAIRPDGLRLASGSEFVGPFNLDGEYKFGDLKTRSHLSEPSTKHAVSALAYRPDGRILAIAYTGDLRPFSSIDFFSFDEARVVRHFIAHCGKISAIAFTPDGEWLVSVGADGGIRCWH